MPFESDAFYLINEEMVISTVLEEMHRFHDHLNMFISIVQLSDPFTLIVIADFCIDLAQAY